MKYLPAAFVLSAFVAALPLYGSRVQSRFFDSRLFCHTIGWVSDAVLETEGECDIGYVHLLAVSRFERL